VEHFLDVYRHTKHPSINRPPYDAFTGRTDILLDQEEAPTFEDHRECIQEETKKWLDKTADNMLARAGKKSSTWLPEVGDIVLLVRTLLQYFSQPNSTLFRLQATIATKWKH